MSVKMTKKFMLLCAVGIAAVAGTVMGASKLRGMKIEGYEVKRTAFADTYTEEGIINTGTPYQVISKVSAPVKSVEAQVNNEVKAGDVLVTLDSRDLEFERALHESALAGYQAQLEQSRISQIMETSPEEYVEALKKDLDTAKAQFETISLRYQAALSLYAEGSISKAEMEETRAVYKNEEAVLLKASNRYEESQQALSKLKTEGVLEEELNVRFFQSADNRLEAQIQAEQTSLALADAQIQDCVITAQRDGIVTLLPAKETSFLAAGQEAAVINGYEEVTAQADVLTSAASGLRVGMPVTVTQKQRGTDRVFAGEIEEVYDFASQGVSALGLSEHRVHVKVSIEGEGVEELKDGYAVNLTFSLYQGEDELTVPSGALFQAEGEDCVYVIEGGRAVKRVVTVAYKSNSQAAIQDGLGEGEMIAADADTKGLYDGARVYH